MKQVWRVFLIPQKNTYRNAVALFIDGNTLWSLEGTTQGDPLAMPMYAISLGPLIRHLSGLAHQVWYAHDAAAGGSILQLREWWSCLESAGRHLGYFTNAKKTWLVVKQEHLDSARQTFAGTGIQVTSTGRPYLGAALGSAQFMQKHSAQCVG